MRSHEFMKRPLAGWLRVVIVSSAFPGILIWEIIRPLRGEVEGKAHRLPRNLAVAGLGGLTVHLPPATHELPGGQLPERDSLPGPISRLEP